MNAILSFPVYRMPASIWNQIKRIGPLGLIIVLHLVFFYALQSGLLKQVAQALPKEVFVNFITPERAPEPAPPKAQPAKPKTLPIVKKSVAPPLPATNTPSPVAAPPTPPEPSTAIAAPPTPVAPAAPAAPALPKMISSGVEYIQAPHPEYPAISNRMGEEGVVSFRVIVNEKGRADSVIVQQSSGFPRLDEAGRQAIRRALFKPYMENGKPIMVSVIVPINFKLRK